MWEDSLWVNFTLKGTSERTEWQFAKKENEKGSDEKLNESRSSVPIDEMPVMGARRHVRVHV